MSELAMTVREMEDRDIPAVLEIQNATHFENWDEKTLQKFLLKTYTFAFVAEAPDSAGNWKLAGYAVFSLAADEAELLAISTAPEFLRKGVATEIFAEGEEALAFAVCNKLTRDIKLIKFYLEETLADVSASCEFYFSDRESLKGSIEQAFRVMGVANTAFFKAKEELEEDE